MKRNHAKAAFVACIFIVAFIFVSCGGNGGGVGGGSSSVTSQGGATDTSSGEQIEANPVPTGPSNYPPSGPALPQPSDQVAQKDDGSVKIDYGNASDGYVIVTVDGLDPEKRLKVQILKSDGAEEVKYNYDIEPDGVPVTFPLQLGDGSYAVKVFQQKPGTTQDYIAILTQEMDVTLNSEFAPFVIPIQLISYDASSASTQKAYELSSGKSTDVEVVAAIYEFLKDNITYDTEKAARVQEETGYIPNPDDTLETGMGICYDYASLAAAMLRANGIPTKLITGNVSPTGIYHAWNMVYIESEGWITKEISVDPNTWELIDTTFAAGSSSGENLANFIGDGSGYTERLFY